MLQSSIAWIDFSEEQRRRMIEVVSLFRQRNTLDELGLGMVRDALANRFFPGTSTIQTRARYFLFVPWLYRSYEERRFDAARIERSLRRDEVTLIGALQASEDREGIIGARAGASLQRFPSSIYWNGLAVWGIRRLSGSQETSHRALERRRLQQRLRPRTDDNEPVAGWGEEVWDPGLPEMPEGFPEEAGFALRPEEAQYLRERLILSCPESLLTTLVDRCQPGVQAQFVWEHPQLALFPKHQQDWIGHAQNLSEAIYGASLLYNLMLAELRDWEERIAQYEEALEAWREDLAAQDARLRRWDRGAFWALVDEERRTPVPTRRFIDSWLDLVLSSAIPDVRIDQHARTLVRTREMALKRGRSRFASPRHLETWSGAAGAFQLDFRWSIAQRITDDILNALSGVKDAGA